MYRQNTQKPSAQVRSKSVTYNSENTNAQQIHSLKHYGGFLPAEIKKLVRRFYLCFLELCLVYLVD